MKPSIENRNNRVEPEESGAKVRANKKAVYIGHGSLVALASP
jgi:hypothetical protein